MKFLLMMNAAFGTGDWDIFQWKPEEIKNHVAYWNSLNAELRAAGELVSVQALTSPREARLVRAGKDGLPATDGVFPETKEFLAGFWIVDVESAQRAHAIAARASAAPGPGGKPMIMPIEVRQVMESPSQDL